MRESVLNALIHLFAIVAAVNDHGVSKTGLRVLKSYLARYLPAPLLKKYLDLFNDYLIFYRDELIKNPDTSDVSENPLLSFQVSNVCHQIRHDLVRKERFIVFVQLFEFVNEDNDISPHEDAFLHSVARAFQIDDAEFQDVRAFILRENNKIQPQNRLTVGAEVVFPGQQIPESPFMQNALEQTGQIFLKHPGISGEMTILQIKSISTFLLRYTGKSELYINIKTISPGEIYLLNDGSIIKGPNTPPLYYADIFTAFYPHIKKKICFSAESISYRFRKSNQGLHSFSFSENGGQLIGIMGGSGVGKSTLLRILNGKLKPQSGKVYFNGLDLYENKYKLKGLIGYIPQDDLLIEELTVYQNLYFNTRLSFGKYSPSQARVLVDQILEDLELSEIKALRVGDVLNNVISGGQRKRLNIGLELIREPSLLFIDEPTSGLSSTDSENIIELLKQQAEKGKLVISTIHQPSSKIYRLFDKIWILDKSGYPVYAGNPVESIEYFKKISAQVDAVGGECPVCGNLNPHQVLEIIEDKKVDDAGNFTRERKIQPEKWYRYYRSNIEKGLTIKKDKTLLPRSNFKVPSDALQFFIFFTRNFLRKLQNRQYWLINLLEAPLLAVILSYFSKYLSDSEYVFSDNKNIPVFLFMAIIVALFMGLTISAEEIYRDRKILERESYLFLSRPVYLNSKILFLFLLSAVQTLSFVLIANSILEIRNMTLLYWLVLFSTSCFGNILGLNISSALDSVIAIYILIPLILVPEILLGGAMIPYDDLNSHITSQKHVPLIGDIMTTRWAFESLAVGQFKDNAYEKPLFQSERAASNASYITSFLIPEMRMKLTSLRQNLGISGKEEAVSYSLGLIKDVFARLEKFQKVAPFEFFDSLKSVSLNQNILDELDGYIYFLQISFNDIALQALKEKDRFLDSLAEKSGSETLVQLKRENHNEKLASLVLNRNQIRKIIVWRGQWIQKKDPVFMIPENNFGRAQMFSAYKMINFKVIDTYLFNLIVIWIMIIVLYFLLIFNVFRKSISWLGLQ
ncbi:MAG: ATP-binding cassette domain-containing protein [Chlorobi bacterium]|nr:ATP-binding cassette domain-containing protein [Chlorobiota bacterium]